MATTNIEKAFKKIEKDFIEISKKAAKEAANKAQADIRKKADQFIDEYYSEYSPKVYKKRKKALYHLVENFYQETATGDGIMIEFGVWYDANKIAGMHKSNSRYHQSGETWVSRLSSEFSFDSSDNGIPEPEWITEKFLSGIHPSGLIGDEGGAQYTSSDEKMQRFFDKELNDKISSYMNDALLNAVKTYF